MNPVPLVMLGVGALMVWAGVTNRDPLTVVKDVLTGKGVPAGRSGVNGGMYGSADAAERQVGGSNNYAGGMYVPGLNGVNGTVVNPGPTDNGTPGGTQRPI